jgi:predicted ATP-grasp superfamily ATP-dependent carboligase
MPLYVILDPNYDYAAYMVKFLAQYDFRGIAVFTEEKHYQIFHEQFTQELGEFMADEYLLTEFSEMMDLATAILNDWQDEEINGIIPWGEFTVEIGAELGEYLGLDWNPRTVVHRFRNKYALKSYLRYHTDLRINASRLVTTEEEAQEFQETVAKWPIVVKPAEGAGSRAVFFAEDMEQLRAYCVEVFKSGQGEILLEEYIGGTEYVVNGITNAEHDVLVTDVWHYDKREHHGIKNLYFQTMKVDRSDPVFEPLAFYAGQLVETLELRKSPFHMELKMDEDGPCLIECGARFAGGNQPYLASELHEHSLFELAACHYMDDLPFSWDDVHYDKYDRYQARIIKGVQDTEIQTISAVYGVEEVKALPSFFMLGFVQPVGSYLPVSTDLFTASYEVYLLHEDKGQIEEDAERVRELIRYE